MGVMKTSTGRGKELMEMLCKECGIDIADTKSIEIRFAVNEVVTYRVTKIVRMEEPKKVEHMPNAEPPWYAVEGVAPKKD